MSLVKPPISELEFLKLTSNHLDFDRKLNSLNLQNPVFAQNALYVGAAWFHLGDEHLAEVKSLLKLSSIPQRAIYSRAYYSAYNASKSVRYLVSGAVSLKGDDHGKAIELPGDFPDKEQWAKVISTLYENRLRADYDNWETTLGDFSESPQSAVKAAEDFIYVARKYINDKLGGGI